ncbi:MAG: sensor histidine kinase [Thermobacillus sp.]|jgi:two-component system sensor histidine kinase YesM|nr:MAG: sensor histidine kinase [Thermobacillus sp.]
MALADLKTLYRNLRIKYKLLVLISAVIATFGILIVVVQQYAFEVYDREIYEQSSAALNQTAAAIENELRKVQQQSYRMAIDEVIQEQLRKIKDAGSDYDRYLASYQIRERIVLLGGLDNHVRSVQLIDAHGGEYSVGKAPVSYTAGRIRLLERETSLTQGGNTWIEPDEEDGALAAARLIRSYEQLSLESLGVLAIRIDMHRLTADVAGASLPAKAALLIYGKERMIFGPAGFEGEERLLRAYAAAASNGYDIIELGGRRYFLTQLPSAYTEWTYVTLIPYDDIFHRLADVKNWTLLAYLLLFLLTVFFAFRFARGITGPIEKLSAKMKRVQMGNFAYEDDEDQRDMPMDETGQLHRNFRIMLQRIDELVREGYARQLAVKESEFKALQAQINPHFLYNTLETINWSAKMARQPHISSMVESLGFLLRSSISLKEPLIPLSQELGIVLHYINIQRIRFEERLDFRLDVPDVLMPVLIPKLSLQPLVENAVNYALEKMTDTCVIAITAEEKDGLIELTVSDNGPGMDESILMRLKSGEVKPKGSGVGLRNIDERIRLLFGEGYGLDIASRRGEGTRVRLRLPIREGGGNQHVPRAAGR